MAQRGIFITLEGGEGTGKSTQVKLLQTALQSFDISCVMTREPGGTESAERIRNILVQRDTGHLDPMSEVLLLFAARREHVTKKILPALDGGQWVISDRFTDSTRAFQGYGMDVPFDKIEGVKQLSIGDFEPDVTFVLDIDPVAGLARANKRLIEAVSTEDRYERMGLAFHQRLREGFLKIAEADKKRCVVIDATQSIEAIHQQMRDYLVQRFSLTVKEVAHG